VSQTGWRGALQPPVAAGDGRKGSRPVMGRKPSGMGALMGWHRKENERIYFELARPSRGDGTKGIGLHMQNRNFLCNTFLADLT
jgi:hypothetical protein